jgi:hypothetical protein
MVRLPGARALTGHPFPCPLPLTRSFVSAPLLLSPLLLLESRVELAQGDCPPGVHRASLDEIAARFGQESEVRRAEMESLRWLVDLASRAGIERVVINGSYVTDIFEPNDVDCVLLIGERTLLNSPAYQELDEGLPFLQIALVEQKEFDAYITDVYATDRRNVSKGMIEVTQ